MEYRAISFVQKLGLFHEQWQPKVIAEMNDYQFSCEVAGRLHLA
jgi:hypothetical protein